MHGMHNINSQSFQSLYYALIHATFIAYGLSSEIWKTVTS